MKLTLSFILKQSAEVLKSKRNQMLPSLQKDVEKHLKNLGMPFENLRLCLRYLTIIIH